MQQLGSEERNVSSANSSPRHSQKPNTIFGLLSKRSTKVEPHPSKESLVDENATAAGSSKQYLSSHDMSFARCSPERQSPKPSKKDKSQTLPANGSLTLTGLGLSGIQRKSKSSSKKNSSNVDGSLSDGGAAEVILRHPKTNKHRSPNHNRFSHQFSLCCKAEKKPATPPVTVRYSSIIDEGFIADLPAKLKEDAMSLSCSAVGENNSLSSEAAVAKVLTSECASAPQSPVAAKSIYATQTSPVQSVTPPNGAEGPIRPLPVSACRSRLRLKLYPPGYSLQSVDASNTSDIKRATTPQHMSSPNIATQPDLEVSPKEAAEQVAPHISVRFRSHDNLQRQSSSSGLARQALMAAQMLSLFPTDQTRERSLLDGRLGSSSLLGPSELDKTLPKKEVTIFVGTWNMNGQCPPKEMNDFVLPANVDEVPDIVAIGTQESSPDRFEWEVTIQETLGASHVLFHSTTLGTLHLAIYLRRDLIWYCSAPEDASMSVRTGSAFRTKGAVAISFCLFGTSMLFVTSHLTAHQQKVKERVSDVKRIINALDLPKNLNLRHKNKDVTQNFDNVFWCGDLNFRLGEPREKLLEWIQNTKFPLPSHLPNGYMHTDQLSSVLSDGAAFRGFMEANITFPPTYKYDPGTQHFDTSSKQRAPAYTDRILYKYRQTQGLLTRRQSILPGASTSTQPHVQCVQYDSVPSITTSDHKPVWALFKTVIRAGTDTIPLAAGLFNREIYLEGMKRRMTNQYSDASAVCSIQ